MSALIALVGRELRLALRQGTDAAAALAFFALVVVLLPLGIGPEPGVLARIAPGAVWVAALLAVLLSLDRLFAADGEDGSLDLLRLADLPLELTVLAKALAHWLATGLPLLLMAPLLALFLNMPAEAYGPLMLGLLLGTPCLSLIGCVGAALIVGARRGGVLLSLLVLPLYIPVLIFGAGAVEAVLAGLTPRPHLLLLAGILAAAVPLAPIAAAAGLRLALE
ncbi:MAG TPA: heme exporter protein CcmB [Alphaproteobacteria bacterium]|nr:heme exporter protein CcmB [Alphaproteobacteria bacterium]